MTPTDRLLSQACAATTHRVSAKVVCALLAPFLFGTSVAAQDVVGTVLMDAGRRPIVGAEVQLRSGRKTAITDSSGQFRLKSVPKGQHQLEIRKLGFRPVLQHVVASSASATTVEILMVSAVVLETVSVTAAGRIPSFDEHRSRGFGHFITRDDLAKQETRRLGDVLSEVSGASVIRGKSAYAWIASRRGSKSTNPKTCGVQDYRGNATPQEIGLDLQDFQNGAKPCQCYALVYLDDKLMYRGSQSGGEPLFNLNSINVDQIEAIEYYAGPSQTPFKYSRLNSNCGVLVIHSRR